MNKWVTLAITVVVGCAPPGEGDVGDDADVVCSADASCTDGAYVEPPDPVAFETFETELVARACAGFFGSDNVNPIHRGILRIPDEKSCLELVTPDHLEPRWPAFVAAMTAGDLTYDAVAAARCLDDVAFAIGNGYMSWMNAGHCVDVLTGLGVEGDACVDHEECAPQLGCTASTCTRPRPCVDTHECPDGEWCERTQCRAFQPKAAEGDMCVVYTDDGFPVDCDVGLTCPMLDYVGDEDDALYFYSTCAVPQEVGERCHRDLDCEFGMRCDRGGCPDHEPCPTAVCAVP